MELRHIRYFLALSEELHFTRAADRCGVSQPCLSAAIRKMEAELGGVLVHRKPQLQLSELGRAMRPLWDQALRNVEQSVELAVGYARGGAPDTPVAPDTGDTPVVPPLAPPLVPSGEEPEVSLAPIRLAIEQIAAAPTVPQAAPVAYDEPADVRSDAIVANLRDRLLVASCRARSAPVLRDGRRLGASARHAARGRKLLLAALAVLLVALAVVLAGRMAPVKAAPLAPQAAATAALPGHAASAPRPI